ncbi:MAG: hypothetical protein E7413_03565 [Ruminococcaceae bacterium]|nr:hypothetical protein [Oscillospiraceae bacterium]
MEYTFDFIESYGMYVNNTSLQQKSSSGGIFGLLAEAVITKGGTVFGAAFCDDFQSVKHIAVNDSEELGKLRGSKYVRSDFSESLSKVQSLLEQGREVLFSGTPCQISALKKILKKDYHNLLTVAVICHGTPKQKVWADYLRELETTYQSKVIAVNFRDKSESYKKYSICIQFANGKQYLKTKDQDIYMCGFLQNITLEKSCFNCHFKGDNIESDIILGDFWGVENIAPELQNNCGTSLVIVRSEKGQNAVNDLLSCTKYQQVDAKKATGCNSSLFCSAKKPENYDLFWDSYDEKQCAKSIGKFLQKKNYLSLLKNKLGKFLAKGKR